MKNKKRGGNIGIGTTTPERLIHIKTTVENFKKTYSLRGRIGIYLLVILGIAELEFINEKEKNRNLL